MVIGAEKAMPSIALHTIRVPIFLDTAQGIMKMTASKSVEALGTLVVYWGPKDQGHLLDDTTPIDLGEWCECHRT